MSALSPRQKRVYEFIRGYISSNGEAPTLGEIAAHFQYRSMATVHRVVMLLNDEGLIRKTPNVSRGIRIVTQEQKVA